MGIEMTRLTPMIQVFDMPESVAFYCDKLGFEIRASSPEIEGPEGRYFHWAWLHNGDAGLMLNTAYDTGKRPAERDGRWAGHRHTCLYIACPDPDAAYDQLVAKGVEAEAPQVQDYGMKQVYVRDPDGYMICFQAPA